MFGVPLDVPSDTFCNNNLVSTKKYVPTFILNKWHNYICHNWVREDQTEESTISAWIRGEYKT